MQTDPAMEWRRLTEEYSQMGDEELRNLAADFDDLTDSAKQALRQEMQSRGLGDPQTPSEASHSAPSRAMDQPPQRMRSASPINETSIFPTDSVLGNLGRAPKLVPDDADDSIDAATGEPRDYTWKTVLCECETTEEAQHLLKALRNSGLDGWVQGSHEFGRRYARVFVAADQLDRARAIAAQPIPQEIVDDSKDEFPEFVEPKCPKCGSEDVVLEGVDPENHWRCEQCDAEWSDPPEIEGDNPISPVDRPS